MTSTVNIEDFFFFLPVSRGYDIVHRWWWGVHGATERLTQAVGACLAEYEPVSDVELWQQTVFHHLVQVVPWGPPQAAAEHLRLRWCVLVSHTRTCRERERGGHFLVSPTRSILISFYFYFFYFNLLLFLLINSCQFGCQTLHKPQKRILNFMK